MSRYRQDPRWIVARFASTCSCGKPIAKGERIYYYPTARKAYCHECGEPMHARFVAECQDEAMISGQSW